MKRRCPKNSCSSDQIIGDGKYWRFEDSKWIQRFKCKSCGKKFSASTLSPFYRQRKRRINARLFALLCSTTSVKDCAQILNITPVTVSRRIPLLANLSRVFQEKLIGELGKNPEGHVQFDDLISKEHTKMKPLTVSLMTVASGANKGLILGAKVGKIPAFGHLAKKSVKKYGKRENQHREALEKLFKSVVPAVASRALIESDDHRTYPEMVGKFFPEANHKRYKGGRGCISGQGELKKQHYDPLFMVNHTCAMLRAKISRLIRKSWCIPKKLEMLQYHLDIYIKFHNQKILAKICG